MNSTTSATVTTSTSTAIISNICTGGATYSTQLLYLNLNLTLPWPAYSFNYTALSIYSATIIFALQNDPSFWHLDDVSVTNSSGSQLLLDGGFEIGNLSSWTYCNPKLASYSGYVTSLASHNGVYSYADGSVGTSDYLSETFTVVPNKTYSVKFWLSATSNHSSYDLVVITS